MVQVGDYLRPLMLKDLRTQCRARGLNPGGGREALAERVGEHMLATQDFTIFAEAQTAHGNPDGPATYMSKAAAAELTEPSHVNNYGRPNGQNVGNHITDRSSSRVLAPPGGASQVYFGDYGSTPEAATPALADVSNQHVGRSTDASSKSPTQQAAAGQDLHQGGSPMQRGHFSGHGMSRAGGQAINNYNRADGQNVGNFLSDRPSSRVLAPPGGASQVFFG